MGPRFASLRHTNVVMAPALTDARQTQKLQLTPTTIASETSDSAFKLSNGKQFSKVIQCKRILSQTQNTLCNLPVKRFIRSTLKTSDKLNFRVTQNKCNNNNINTNLNNGSFNKPKINLESQVVDNKVEEQASDYLPLQSGCGFIMNNSGTSMGDLDGNMGLNKSDNESLNYMKEKGSCSSEVDQLFRNFQNVDEILQVIKSMESGTGEGENEIVPMDAGPSTDSEGMNSIFPIPDSSELQSGLANFDRELFTDVDVMNICGDEHLSDSNIIVNKETFIKDKVEEVQKKQYYMERKLQRLLRRLHKMQARTIGKHACEEVTGFLENLNRAVHSTDSGSTGSVSKHPHSSSMCDGNCDKDCKKKAVNNISVLIRRLEQASQQQASAAHRHTKTCRYFGSGSRDYSSLLSSANGLKNFPLASAIVPKLSETVKSEVEDVTGQLHTQLKAVENGVDSDVTASSSGGESCDEMPSSSQPNQQQQTQPLPQQNLSISKRAIWRWAHDRAEIASKWTWLQAQVTDLEYRIRQHTEYHRQIRTSKRVVVLQGDEPVVVNGYHGADSATSSSRTRPLVRSLFGKRKLLYVEGLHNVSKKAARPSTLRCGCRPPDPPCALCTGRPDPTHPRDHPDLMTVNERVALLDPAFHPVLSFPSDISQSIHFEALMRNPEWQQKAMRSSIKLLRVMGTSLLDRSSSSSDIILDGRRLGGNNVSSNRRLIMAGPPSAGDNGMTSTVVSTSINKKFNTSGVRKNTTSSLSDKIKKLARGRKVKGLKDSNNHLLDRINARKRIARHSTTHLDGVGNSIEDITGSSNSSHLSSSGLHTDGYGSYDHHHDHDSNSCRPSPVPSPTPLSAGSKEHTRRKRENSYDIDNIVIPYSVASATRLEKLQYKEILTPKWRVSPIEPLTVNKLDTKNNGVVRRPSSHESDIEDMSEEAIISRHERCEQEERKKFSTYLKLPSTFARTRHRRTDSRAESSGANTPDPMSPATIENIKEGGSPVISPPATPLAAVNEIDGNEASVQNVQASIMKHGPGRRRTISLSQAQTRLTNQTIRCEKEDTRPNTPVDLPNEVVSPYEPRTFPLPDDVYEKLINSMPPGHSSSSAPNSSIVPPSSEIEAPSNSGNITNDSISSGCIGTPTPLIGERGETSRPLTPLSDSTESAIEEDPNDPEWTVTSNSLTVDRPLSNKR